MPGSGRTRLLQDLKKALDDSGKTSTEPIDLGLPGVAAEVRLQGLTRVAQSRAPRSTADRVFLLDGAERVLGQLREACTQGTVVASADPAWIAENPEGFEIIQLDPLDLASWMSLAGAPPLRLLDYLEHGGLFTSGRHSPATLVALLERTCLRNVLMRTEVRDPEILISMAVGILGSPGRPISATRLRKAHTRSLDQARMFLAHLQSAGLVRLVGRLEDRGRRSAQASRLGFARETATPLALWAGTEDLKAGLPPGDWVRGWLMNAIMIGLLRDSWEIFCWREEDRWGLALAPAEDAPASLLLDVQLSGEAPARELELAMRRHGVRRGLVLRAGSLDKQLEPPGTRAAPTSWEGIREMGLEEWLFDSHLPRGKSTDVKVYRRKSSRGHHLL